MRFATIIPHRWPLPLHVGRRWTASAPPSRGRGARILLRAAAPGSGRTGRRRRCGRRLRAVRRQSLCSRS